MYRIYIYEKVCQLPYKNWKKMYWQKITRTFPVFLQNFFLQCALIAQSPDIPEDPAVNAAAHLVIYKKLEKWFSTLPHALKGM